MFSIANIRDNILQKLETDESSLTGDDHEVVSESDPKLQALVYDILLSFGGRCRKAMCESAQTLALGKGALKGRQQQTSPFPLSHPYPA